MNKKLLVSILLCILSVSVMAETDLSSIEAQERAQIISELTYKLETKENCTQTLNWDDSGSGADLDGYFFIPNAKNSEFIIGGHASGKRSSKYHCVTTVSEATGNPKETPVLLVAPVDWKRIWKDSGSGATKDGSFWQAIPPDDNYKCIGSVSQLTHNQKPQLANYRCVHISLTDKIDAASVVWSDKGTGAEQQVTIFNLPNTGTFTAVASRASNITTYNLKKNATSVPDPKKVEEILAKRIAPIKADIEAKTKALQEQKEAAKNEEAAKQAANKAAAKKAEQKKIAAAAEEKKKQEVEKQKALTAQVEARQDDNSEEEAQELKEEQQARIAKAMEEKAAAKEAKQKEAVAKQVQEEKAKKEETKSEPKDEIVAEQAAKIEREETSTEITSSSEPKNETKGLNDILMFFLKIFGMMIGGVIIFMIVFKVLFGKKMPTGK